MHSRARAPQCVRLYLRDANGERERAECPENAEQNVEETFLHVTSAKDDRSNVKCMNKQKNTEVPFIYKFKLYNVVFSLLIGPISLNVEMVDVRVKYLKCMRWKSSSRKRKFSFKFDIDFWNIGI